MKLCVQFYSMFINNAAPSRKKSWGSLYTARRVRAFGSTFNGVSVASSLELHRELHKKMKSSDWHSFHWSHHQDIIQSDEANKFGGNFHFRFRLLCQIMGERNGNKNDSVTLAKLKKNYFNDNRQRKHCFHLFVFHQAAHLMPKPSH